ncbi:MAG: amino acid racemase, partial [Clostridiaceae bacterium]|nr:amino acid racemase [Clostridiaceae bacterium]
MGPRSTTPFLELVIDQCQIQYGAKYDIDYPHIMIYSLPTPFYIDREIDHSLMKRTIIDGLRKLEATGVSFIAMPCNSAHAYFQELKDSIDIPLLNIVEETINCLPEAKQRITIFATETTVKSRLYQKGIIPAGHEFIFMEQWQAKVNNIINSIKMKKDRELIISLWKELIREVKGQGADGIIMACTDLSILNNVTEPDLNLYDSSEALAKSTVKRYLRSKQDQGYDRRPINLY